MDEYLYHYTSVETLALILSNKTIRFNSLEDVDDLQEKESRDLQGLGKYIFISCWTEDSVEQIPMWKMYGSIESGVRIRLRKYPFKEKENRVEDIISVAGDRMHVSGDSFGLPKSMITFSEQLRWGAFSAGFIKQTSILHKVEYTDDERKLYPTIVSCQEEDIRVGIGEMGKYKNTGWSFQKEWRYVLPLIPLDFFTGNPYSAFLDSARGILKNTARMPISHFDCEIEEAVFAEMEITLSPKISAGNRVIVNSLVEKYNPSATIKESTFAGILA